MFQKELFRKVWLGGRLAGAGVKGGNGGVNLMRNSGGTSLVVQWLSIHLPMQGMWV